MEEGFVGYVCSSGMIAQTLNMASDYRFVQEVDDPQWHEGMSKARSALMCPVFASDDAQVANREPITHYPRAVITMINKRPPSDIASQVDPAELEGQSNFTKKDV
jgi:hypothetical protein